MTHHQGTGDNHPLSNLEYDWITLIQNKAQALIAYDSYIRDAEQAGSQECAELFRRIHEAWAKARDDMRQWFRVAELSFDNYVSVASARR